MNNIALYEVETIRREMWKDGEGKDGEGKDRDKREGEREKGRRRSGGSIDLLLRYTLRMDLIQ